ncbi:hypothetical protein [Spirilliplanes yamanashiensis]|uniref:Uncharacterized protein n=1 Tax=Spirilliplanes yamanashiensis TaxID=42233 RepID=A0A8J3Y708_9ACTN|nr:hypothetical protein [Spirilliplanes yamanashiensis]MDP9815032.1 hypothetical protein [Spirilliplanes yamanashiensis]GIJ02689.1 hypothetical protein Sya03_20410 [Spirilliplanes yamanashiensis]
MLMTVADLHRVSAVPLSPGRRRPAWLYRWLYERTGSVLGAITTKAKSSGIGLWEAAKVSREVEESGELMRAFFEDLASDRDGVANTVREAISSPNLPIWVDDTEAVLTLRRCLTSPEQVDALARFVREMVCTAQHSALVAIDGGSASAEVGRLQLTDDHGHPLDGALHELYIGYLFDTGRMT